MQHPEAVTQAIWPRRWHPSSGVGLVSAFLSSDWHRVREALEDCLIHGDTVSELDQNELARHGLRLGDFLDLPDKSQAKELFLLGWMPFEIALILDMDEPLVAESVARISPSTWQILRGHAEGLSVKQLHASTPFTRTWIYKVLASRGLTPNVQPGRASELSARKKEEVLRRWRIGEPLVAIATQTGATIHQVNYIVRKNR